MWPAALPQRNPVQAPGAFIAARRPDGRRAAMALAKYEAPSRKTLEDLFMEDSKERDKPYSSSEFNG